MRRSRSRFSSVATEEKRERDRRIGYPRLDITPVRDVANLARVLRSINRLVNAILSEIVTRSAVNRVAGALQDVVIQPEVRFNAKQSSVLLSSELLQMMIGMFVRRHAPLAPGQRS